MAYPRICLTGGIACGKSLLSRFLRELGAETLDADDIVHEIIPDPAERRRLADEVFRDPRRRAELEARLHPIVRERLNAFMAGRGERLRIAVVPLLFEVQWQADYDIILCVVSSVSRQIGRMMSKRGYSRDEALNRLSAQMPVAEKARRANCVIANDGTAEELQREAAAWMASMRTLAESGGRKRQQDGEQTGI